MKFFAVLAVFVALAASSPITKSEWTLEEISAALQDPSTDPALVPVLEDALNNIMSSLMEGGSETSIDLSPSTDGIIGAGIVGAGIAGAGIVGAVPALIDPIIVESQVAPSHWTFADINNALANPNTNPILIPYLNHARDIVMEEIYETIQQESILIAVPQDTPLELPLGAVAAVAPIEATAASQWTLEQLSAALENPDTNPALVPYLENALNHLMLAMFNGASSDSILVVVPTSITQSISFEPVIVDPIVIDPEVSVPVVVAPEVVEPEVVVPEVVEPEVTVPIVVEPEATVPAVVDPVSVIEQAPVVDAVSVVEEAPAAIELPGSPLPEVVIQPEVVEQPIEIVEQPIVPVSPVTIEQGDVAVSASPLVQLIININQE